MFSKNNSSTMANGLQQRAAWLRLLSRVHWISSALGLVAMLFFATTGITLNNAETFENNVPVVMQHKATLPAEMLTLINELGRSQTQALPEVLRSWVKDQWSVSLSPKAIEWRDDELYLDLKRPGVDAWLSVDRKTGAVQYQAEDHGWVAYFNDLHKGKNAGSAWHWLIDGFGICCLLFSLTGLLILQAHAKSRWSIWPITGLGLVLPLLTILLFVH